MPEGEGGEARGRLSCSRVSPLWWLKDPMVLLVFKKICLLTGRVPRVGGKVSVKKKRHRSRHRTCSCHVTARETRARTRHISHNNSDLS